MYEILLMIVIRAYWTFKNYNEVNTYRQHWTALYNYLYSIGLIPGIATVPRA